MGTRECVPTLLPGSCHDTHTNMHSPPPRAPTCPHRATTSRRYTSFFLCRLTPSCHHPSSTPGESRMVHASATPTALAPCRPPLAPGATLAPPRWRPGSHRLPVLGGHPQRPDGQIWAEEWAVPGPWRWSWYLGRAGGSATCRAAPTWGPLPAVSRSSATGTAESRSGTSACFVQPRLCLGTSWVSGLWAGGRGTHTPTQAAPSCLPTNKGPQGRVVRAAGPPGTYGAAILGDRHLPTAPIPSIR